MKEENYKMILMTSLTKPSTYIIVGCWFALYLLLLPLVPFFDFASTDEKIFIAFVSAIAFPFYSAWVDMLFNKCENKKVKK